jgi:hypothetical protein
MEQSMSYFYQHPASMQCLWGSHSSNWLDVTVPLSGKSNILTICQNHTMARLNKKVDIGWPS